MMLAPAALALAGALAVATWRQRQRHRMSKPQRRFRLHLSDNSEAPFVHWSRQQADATPCSHATCKHAAGTAVTQQDVASQQQLEQHGQAQDLHQHQHQQLAQCVAQLSGVTPGLGPGRGLQRAGQELCCHTPQPVNASAASQQLETACAVADLQAQKALLEARTRSAATLQRGCTMLHQLRPMLSAAADCGPLLAACCLQLAHL